MDGGVLARRAAEVFICDRRHLLGCQTTYARFQDDYSSSLVGAVDLCASTELI